MVLTLGNAPSDPKEGFYRPSRLFNEIRQHVVSWTGFEPVIFSLKGRCLNQFGQQPTDNEKTPLRRFVKMSIRKKPLAVAWFFLVI